VIIVCSIIIIPFTIWKSKIHDIGNFRGERYSLLQVDHFELPKQEIIIPKINPPPKIAEPDLKYISPVVVDSVLQIDKMQFTDTDKNDLKRPDDSLKLNANNRENDLIFGEDQNGIAGDYTILQTQPSFKGGDREKFREWVSRNTNYPKNAQDSGIFGKVMLSFIIETDGSVDNVKILKGIGSIVDDEAIRAIKSSPKWTPGTSNGRPVRVRYQISLLFRPIR
jgi:protein TonB